MEKKIYIEPSMVEVDLDEEVNVMMASKETPGPGGGRPGGRKSLEINEDEMYTDPFATVSNE